MSEVTFLAKVKVRARYNPKYGDAYDAAHAALKDMEDGCEALIDEFVITEYRISEEKDDE